LQRAYSRLLQNEKMAAVGQLAAGVAHEINNPIGFVTSNLQTLRKYVGRFLEMLAFSRGTIAAQLPDPEIFHRKWRELKLDFVSTDVPELLRQSLEGTERVKQIVADLKGFSHVDESERSSIDINHELERTLGIIARTLPEQADVVKDFQPLPNLVGNGSLLCQAFMNIILNAAQARPKGLCLTIGTRYQSGRARIVFADNGPGIAAEIRGRIFEPFFTTRDVGQGTGMGLTVAYDIITTMGGEIEVVCPDAGGSVFTITLPLQEK
jgi:signal transduction histidine kinase